MAEQDDELEHSYSNCVRTRDIAQKTCQRRLTIGKSGERGSGISVLVARQDDDDDIYIYISGAETGLVLLVSGTTNNSVNVIQNGLKIIH